MLGGASALKGQERAVPLCRSVLKTRRKVLNALLARGAGRFRISDPAFMPRLNRYQPVMLFTFVSDRIQSLRNILSSFTVIRIEFARNSEACFSIS